MPPVIAAWPETSGLVSVLMKSHAASWFLRGLRHGRLPAAERHEGRVDDLGILVPLLGLVVADLGRARQDAEPTLPAIFDCLGSAAITPVSPQPIDSATWPPATAAFTSPNEKFSALGGASFEALDIFLEAAHPAGIVDLRIHRVGIEEHRARIVGMVGVGRRVAEEEPELLAAAPEGLRRAPQALVGTRGRIRRCRDIASRSSAMARS